VDFRLPIADFDWQLAGQAFQSAIGNRKSEMNPWA
jgi:hypothetical protein